MTLFWRPALIDEATDQTVLDIVADQGRCAMLTEHRILCLVQCGNPDITFDPVGAVLQVIPLVVTVLMIGLAVRAWADGDVVAGCLLVVFAVIGVWRRWRTLRHLTGRD